MCIELGLFFLLTAINSAENNETVRKKGPFTIGKDESRTVTAEIYSSKTSDRYQNQIICDVTLLIKDQNGVLLLKKEFNPQKRDAVSYDVEAIDAPGIGKVLLLSENIDPGAPGTGSSYRLFRFNSKGEFVPITGVISPYCIKIKSNCFEIVPYGENATPAIKSESWTTSFFVIYHYPINPEGHAAIKAIPIKKRDLPVEVDLLEAMKGRKNYAEWYPNQKQEITLYSTKNFNDQKTLKIVVKTDSKIQFLDATPDKDNKNYIWWLHISIDGQEGYVKDLEDFRKLGLPFAG